MRSPAARANDFWGPASWLGEWTRTSHRATVTTGSSRLVVAGDGASRFMQRILAEPGVVPNPVQEGQPGMLRLPRSRVQVNHITLVDLPPRAVYTPRATVPERVSPADRA